MTPLRTLALVVAGATLFLAFPSPTTATLVLDQSHDGSADRSAIFSGGAIRRAQSFTVGEGGILTFVDLRVSGAAPAAIQISTMSSGKPSATIVATAPFSLSTVDGWARYDVSGASLPVNVDEHYAIEPIQPGQDSRWLGSTALGYSGGEEFFVDTGVGVFNWTPSADGESFFRTWVDLAPIGAPSASFGRVKALFGE